MNKTAKTTGKILVTGADGYIGSHLVEGLLTQGYDVRCFVCYNSFGSWGWLDTLPEEKKNDLDIIAGDIRDPHFVKHAMQGCDVVLHLAALIAIPFSYHAPDAYIDTNVKGTLNVVQAAKELGISKIVSTSTSEVYGTAQFVPMTEDHPLQAQSPYAASKIAADQIALSFYRSFETPVSIIRPFNAYGPRQSMRAVIPSIIGQLVNGKTSIKLGSITPTRDFSFVEDTVSGFIAVMHSDKAIGETINIGSGFEVSIEDVVNVIGEEMGVNVNIITDEQRIRPDKSEVERLYASIDKARNVLNWEPAYGELPGFRKGIAKTIAWFSKPENIALYKTDRYNI